MLNKELLSLSWTLLVELCWFWWKIIGTSYF